MLGSSGRGGAFEDVEVTPDAVEAVDAAVLDDPVSPTEALVAPALLSHGFGGDGEAISPVYVSHRPVIERWEV